MHPGRAHRAKLPVLALGCGLLLMLAVVRVPTIPDSPLQVDLDGDAFTSLGYRMQWGSLSGRDFDHTYGLLGQGLTRLAIGLHQRGDAASSLPLILLCFWALNVLLLGLLLLLVPGLGWKEAGAALLLLTHLEIPFHYPTFRALAAMIAAAVLAHACSAVTRPRRLLLAAGAAALCLAAQLLSAESGVYALVASAGVAVLGIAFGRDDGRRRADAECLAMLAGSAAILQGVLAWLLSIGTEPRGFLGYHRGLLRVASGYALVLGHAWDLPALQTSALVAFALLTLVLVLRHVRRAAPLERRLLVGLALASLLQAKGALTRSDVGHILLAFTPAVVLWAMLLREWRRPGLPSPLWPLAFAALLVGWPASGIAWRYARAVLQGDLSPGAAWTQARSFRLATERLLPEPLLRAHASERGPVLVLPFQNHLAMALGRPLAGGVHQAYSAYDLDLQRELLSAMSRAGPGLTVFYAVDGLATPALDGAETPARLPLVFERLAEGYRLAPGGPTQGYLALLPRSTPHTLSRRPLQWEGTDGPASVRLRESAGCGLLELRLRVRYPWWLPLSHAARLEVLFLLRGVPVATRVLVPLTSDGEFPSLISLAPPADLARVFDGQAAGGLEWDALSVQPDRSDRLGIVPRELALRSLACLGG